MILSRLNGLGLASIGNDAIIVRSSSGTITVSQFTGEEIFANDKVSYRSGREIT